MVGRTTRVASRSREAYRPHLPRCLRACGRLCAKRPTDSRRRAAIVDLRAIFRKRPSHRGAADRRRPAEQWHPALRAKPGAGRPIRAGDLLLLDMWAKLAAPDSVYYDITWVGYLGD